jgi:hypothetical protein
MGKNGMGKGLVGFGNWDFEDLRRGASRRSSGRTTKKVNSRKQRRAARRLVSGLNERSDR